MEYRRSQNHQQQQNPSFSTPPTTKARGLQEEDDEWWKSDEEEEEEEGSMATKAIRASSGARRDSSLSSAYAAPHPLHPKPQPPTSVFQSQSQNRAPHSGVRASWMKDSIPGHVPEKRNSADSNSKPSFWSTITRKAKSIIEDEGDVQSQPQSRSQPQGFNQPTVPPQSHKIYSAGGTQFSPKQFRSPESAGQNTQKSSDGARLHKGFGAIASSLNYIGNALEEGLTIVENRTADIIQETRKLNVRKKFGTPDLNESDRKDQNANRKPQMHTNTQPQVQSDLEIQLKASRDVAMAMAAKTKVLLRELKTVKADLAFAKERCAQLEEENKLLRESLEKGDNPEDDDLIRLQLESLLAEKARLAHENSVYARENRFLREIVEYRQLTMQDVVYLDENSEEVTEVYPANVPSLTSLHAVDTNQPPVSPPKPLQQA